MREVAEHARIRPRRQGGRNVRDVDRRCGTRGEAEGYYDRAAQVPDASAYSFDKAGLSLNEGLRACAAVRRVSHGSQIVE
eukprot:6212451-Pleurochrysis_carterae.AAC.9